MQYRQNKSVVVVCVILLAFAGFFVFVDTDVFMLRIFAVGFLLLAGTVLTVGFYMLSMAGKSHNVVFLRSGVGSALILYASVTTVLSFISNLFAGNLTLYLMINVGVVLLTGVAVFLLVLASRNIASSDMRTMGKMAFMNEVERRLFNLLADSANAAYHTEINKLHDMVKYADKIGVSEKDYVLDGALSRLESALATGQGEGSQVNIPAMLDDINTMLIKRKGEISESKRGGF